jgi:hypothetical protein
METETEKFYQWMQNINNAFLSDNVKMANAFRIIALESELSNLKTELSKAKLRIKILDPVFEKPISEIKVTYELVNPKS